MYARATTTISVYRGTTTDVYGDEVDTEQPLYTGVRASIIENRRRPYQPAEGEMRVVRYATCRVSSKTDVVKNDRIKDERTGFIYFVEEIHDQKSPAFTPDLVLDCSRTN